MLVIVRARHAAIKLSGVRSTVVAAAPNSWSGAESEVAPRPLAAPHLTRRGGREADPARELRRVGHLTGRRRRAITRLGAARSVNDGNAGIEQLHANLIRSPEVALPTRHGALYE